MPLHEVLDEHVSVTSALHPLHLEQAREHHRNLNDAEVCGLRRFVEHHAEVEALVAQVGKRVTGIDGDGREDWKDLVVEPLVQRT